MDFIGSHPLIQVLLEKPIASVHGELNTLEAVQCVLTQTAFDRIAHDQRADECGAANGGAKQNSKMATRVETQASPDKEPEGHRILGSTAFKSA